jgi:hypothetical protein
MPRPINKEDLKELRANYAHRNIKFLTDEVLGLVVRDMTPGDNFPWSYRVFRARPFRGLILLWVRDGTFKLRKKLGQPKPRKKHIKQIMREPDFPLDEIALAQEIMEGLK